MSAKYDIGAIKSAAKGRWREIARSALGIPEEALSGEHGPCPKCSGTDRWRVFADFAETGGAICNQCGRDLGDGFSLAQWWLGIGFREAVMRIADHLGIKASDRGRDDRSGNKANPARHLRFLDWHEGLATTWCALRKPGVTPAAMVAAGCRLARYRNRFTVFALPVWGPQLTAADPVGWCLYDVGGGTLPRYLKGKPPSQIKTKLTHGSKPGIMGPVDRISTATTIWKVEGPTDLLALLALDLPDDATVVTNANGACESPSEWVLDLFADKRVHVLHDADRAGEHGAIGFRTNSGRWRAGWAERIAARAASCFHIRLPYAIADSKGHDLRDWLNEGHTYAELLQLASTATPVKVAAHLPEVSVPGGSVTITSSAELLGSLLAETGNFFVHGGTVVRMYRDAHGQPRLAVVKPSALCSDFELVARLVRVRESEDGEEYVPTTCSESVARRIIESAGFQEALPQIKVLSSCPVLIERNGELIQVAHYDQESGILAGGEQVPDMDLADAISLLDDLVAEFRFATEGDRARALAAVITPALVT